MSDPFPGHAELFADLEQRPVSKESLDDNPRRSGMVDLECVEPPMQIRVVLDALTGLGLVLVGDRDLVLSSSSILIQGNPPAGLLSDHCFGSVGMVLATTWGDFDERQPVPALAVLVVPSPV